MPHSIASAPELQKKTRVGEASRHQPLGQALLARDLEEVRAVPKLLALLGERLDQMGVRMAERGHRDAGGEIEVAPPVGRVEICPLAALEGDVGRA